MPAKIIGLLACAALWAAGCAGPQVPKPSGHHPANPNAVMAPLAAPSDTLEVRDPVEMQQEDMEMEHMHHGGDSHE